MTHDTVVFLFDVDNTLLDNDRVTQDLRARLSEDFANAPFDYWTRGLSGGIGGSRAGWAPDAMHALYEHGVWAVFSSFNDRALQWKPVMVMTVEEADQVVGQVRAALG